MQAQKANLREKKPVLSRLLKNTQMFRCRSIASLQRTASTPSLVIFRAPRTWIFLSSLQEPFLNTLL
jgi:hypothetical protein